MDTVIAAARSCVVAVSSSAATTHYTIIIIITATAATTTIVPLLHGITVGCCVVDEVGRRQGIAQVHPRTSGGHLIDAAVSRVVIL